jgi:hypothetical protein
MIVDKKQYNEQTIIEKSKIILENNQDTVENSSSKISPNDIVKMTKAIEN